MNSFKEETINQQNIEPKIFKNLTIYSEIFNNNIEQSNILDDVLTVSGANVKF
jgi:hypothetical protein